MKILFLTENFPPETNAAANRVYERACYWVEWGHEVTVVTCAPNFPQGKLHAGYRNRWYQTEEMDGIRVVRVKTYISANRGTLRRTLDFLSFLFAGFAGAAIQTRPDVVAATSPQFFSAVAGWLVGMVRRVPFVFELGDIWPASITAVGAMKPSLPLRLLERLELFLYRRSACVIALTPAFRRNLIGRGIDGDKIAVVINGVDLPRYTPRERDAGLAAEWGLAESFVISYVGTHGMAHGLGNVLDAADILRDRPGIRFLFVGDGAERPALMASAHERGLDNVVFIGALPKDTMPRVWSLSDVALVHLKADPVFSEVIPSKMFEAMAMGVPILLSAPDGEASRILSKDAAGMHVPAGDSEALAAAIRRLADDDAFRRDCSRAALTAAPHHSRRYQAEEMLRILDAASAGDGGRVGQKE